MARPRGWQVSTLAGVGTAVLALSTAGASPGGGDAPETTAGVASVGILHAPGYATYVLAARLFAWLVPVGSLGQRVQWFSILCAAATATLVVQLARRAGASDAAALVGAGALATAASFWFNATYAKHGAFTALLVAGALTVAAGTDDDDRMPRVLATGALIGLAVGAGWYAMAVALPAVGWLLARRPGAPRRLVVVAAVATVTAGLVIAWIVLRSSQDPAMAWGGATTPARLVALLTLDDFGYGPGAIGDLLAGAGADDTAGGPIAEAMSGLGGRPTLADLPRHLGSYAAVLWRDLGAGAVLAALAGLMVARRRPVVRAMGLLIAVDLVVVAAALGVEIRGFESGLLHGNFFLPALIGFAVAAAVGVDGVADRLRRHRRLAVGPPPLVVGVLAAVVLIPSVVVHGRVAAHPDEPLAERYAIAVLDPLPAEAIVLTGGTERSFPLDHAQVVLGHRTDVTVVRADALRLAWYREQLLRRQGLAVPESAGSSFDVAAEMAVGLAAEDRPVYVDTLARRILAPTVTAVPEGLVARVLPEGEAPPLLLDPTVATRLEQAVDAAGLLATTADSEWPHDHVQRSYRDAAVHSGLAFLDRGQLGPARQLLELAWRLDPDHRSVQDAMAAFTRATAGA